MTKKQFDSLPDFIQVVCYCADLKVFVNDKELDLFESLKVWNHSPSGFNWGYGGSGPAQTALAILMRFMSDEDAARFHQDFKFKQVALWPMGQDVDRKIPLKQIIQEILQERHLLFEDGHHSNVVF